LIVRDALVPVVIGAIVGSTVASGTNGLVVHFLFETTPTDPLTMIAVVALVSTTALVAALFLLGGRWWWIRPSSCVPSSSRQKVRTATIATLA
jgi:hypothetical protein